MGEYTPIRNLKIGMSNMNLMFIVLDVGRCNTTKDGHEVRTVKVADKTGSVNLSLWDEPGKLVVPGDIIRMTRGYTQSWKNCLTLYMGKGGEFVKVAEFCLIFSEAPFMSEPNPDATANATALQSSSAKPFSRPPPGGNSGLNNGTPPPGQGPPPAAAGATAPPTSRPPNNGGAWPSSGGPQQPPPPSGGSQTWGSGAPAAASRTTPPASAPRPQPVLNKR